MSHTTNNKDSIKLISELSNDQIEALSYALERCYIVDFTKKFPTYEDRTATYRLSKLFPNIDIDCGLHHAIHSATKSIDNETKLNLLRSFTIKYEISNFVDKLVSITVYDENYDDVYYEWLKLESILKILCVILNQSMPDPDDCNSVQDTLKAYVELWHHLDKNVIPPLQ